MTLTQPHSWLPDDAITGVRTSAALDKCLAQWGEEWLAEGALVVTGLSIGQLLSGNADGCLTGSPPLISEISVSCESEDHSLRLAAMLLGREIQPRQLRTAQDRTLLDMVTKSALDGLTDSLSEVFGRLPPASSGSASVEASIAPLGDAAILTVRIPRELVIAKLRDNAPRPRELTARQSLGSAMAGQDIRLGAVLGSSNLTLAEAENLQVGDVIVLDTVSSSPLEITIDGQPAADAAARIDMPGSTYTLLVERSASQW